MRLLPYVAQNYHPLLYHNYEETCCLFFPTDCYTRIHNAGRRILESLVLK